MGSFISTQANKANATATAIAGPDYIETVPTSTDTKKCQLDSDCSVIGTKTLTATELTTVCCMKTYLSFMN